LKEHTSKERSMSRQRPWRDRVEPLSGGDDSTKKRSDKQKRGSLTARDRLTAALHHQVPDRLCVDLGAGGQTGMGVCAVHRLRQALLGRSDHRVKVIEPYQMLGEIDEELCRALQVDVVGVPAPTTMFGFPCEGWKPFVMHDGTPCLVPARFNYTRDGNGAFLLYPQGDTAVPPCAKMPVGSYFFDAIIRQRPIDEKRLDPADNCEEFGLLSDDDIKFTTQHARWLYEKTDYGIYMALPGAAFGDIALVPGTWLKDPKGIRDVEEWYISTVMRPDYVRRVFETQCAIVLQNIERLAQAVREYVQVVFVSGTDFGHQNGLFCSIETFRNLYQPFYRAVNDKIHALTNWKTFIHSCGAVHDLIPEFIDAGFDILNPIQTSAAGMDPVRLKKEFGKDLVLWGGGVDTQKTLPFGKPREVYREVRERIDILAEGGGYVFSTIHNVQSDVPTSNILAMVRALHDARGLATEDLPSWIVDA